MALKRGMLLPIAQTVLAYYRREESHWLEAMHREMIEEQRAEHSGQVHAVILRLRTLQGGGAGEAVDPRPASNLFEGLAVLEEAAVRNEVSDLPFALQAVAIEDIGEAVLLPDMREEVARNGAILQGKQIEDIPELLARSEELAASYREDPRFLMAPVQRQTMIPGLLAAFVGVELVERGWMVRFTVEDGLLVSLGDRNLNPHAVVKKIHAGEMDRAEYLALIGSIDGRMRHGE